MKELDLIGVIKSFNSDDFLKFFDKTFTNKFIINLLVNEIDINDMINDIYDRYFVEKYNVGLFDDSVLDENSEIIYDTVIDWILDYYHDIMYSSNFVRYISLRIVDTIMSEPHLTSLRAHLFDFLTSGQIRNY